MSKLARDVSLGLIVGMAVLLILAVQSLAGPVPPLPDPEAAPLEGPTMVLQPEVSWSAASPSGDISGFRPLGAGVCSSAQTVSCGNDDIGGELVVEWYNNTGPQWDSYSCMSPTIFASLPHSETLFSLAITQPDRDFALAIPQTLTGMNTFGAIMTDCNSDNCIAPTHNKDKKIYEHAIVPNAPQQTYLMAIDSPNVGNGYGDAIISCGSHNTGWCENPDVFSTTLTCGDYSFHDSTIGSADRIIHYGLNLAWDGPEVAYKVVLTESRYLSFTLHYTGNKVMDYNNYMAFFVLPQDCNQRTVLMFAGDGETPLGTNPYHARWLPKGTYYLVVDGSHMPSGGDEFDMDVACTTVELTKSATDLSGPPLYPGDTVEYTVLMTNVGGLKLTSIGVQDPMPGHTTYVAGSAQATPVATISGPSPLRAEWAELGPGETVTLTYRVTLDLSAVDKKIRNSVTASTPFLPDLQQGTVEIGPVRPPIDIAKTVVGSRKSEPETGDIITYTITAINRDSVAVNGYTISDSLPVYATYVAGSAVPAPTVVGPKGPVWDGQSIGPGATKTYVFEAQVGTVPDGEKLKNTAWLKQPGRAQVQTFVIGPTGTSFVYLPMILKNK